MIVQRARDLNDNSLELLIALGRWTAVTSALALLIFLVAQAWWPALVTFSYAAGVGWLSWWYFGNSSWRGRVVRVCGKHSPGGNLVCNVAITEDNMTHVGLHGDGLRDPEGAHWWK